MPLETASHIASLNATNPASGDAVAQADDHLRLIKSVLTTDFATINAAITATPTEINSLGGILKTQLDRAGSLTTAGTATAYTLTSNTVFASLSAMNGKAIVFKPHVTSGAAPTLNVDGLGAIALKSIAGTVIPTGALLIGGRYAVTYNDSATEFVVHGIFGVLPATQFSGAVTVQSGGLTVTAGGLTATDGTFSSTLSLQSTDAGATQGPSFDVFRDSASPAASDVIGAVVLNGRSSTGVKRTYVQLVGIITSPTNAAEGANFVLQSMVAGTPTTVLQSSGADIAIPGSLGVTGTITGKHAAPTFQVLTSGTAATYTPTAGAVRIEVTMIGGGGGGGAVATNNGGTGGTTSFNSVTAVGGSGGSNGGSGGVGGAGGTGGTGTAAYRIPGSPGWHFPSQSQGGRGGNGLHGGGGGQAGFSSGGGSAGATNSGGGGGGGGQAATNSGGGGGGGEIVILPVLTATTYTYTVGAAGTLAAAGTQAGGAGGSGVIIVKELYV